MRRGGEAFRLSPNSSRTSSNDCLASPEGSAPNLPRHAVRRSGRIEAVPALSPRLLVGVGARSQEAGPAVGRAYPGSLRLRWRSQARLARPALCRAVDFGPATCGNSSTYRSGWGAAVGQGKAQRLALLDVGQDFRKARSLAKT